MHLYDMIAQAHITAKEKGFWEDRDNNPLGIATALMLINSELVEAMNVDRANDIKQDSAARMAFCEELADVVIRLCDLAGYLNLDVDAMIQAKMEVNAKRPRKHGKRY